MENLFYFEHEDFGEVRAVLIDEEPYFIGKDIAESLGYAKDGRAVALHVSEDNKRYTPIKSGPCGTRVMVVINESGLYELIAASKTTNKRALKQWFIKEVLPKLRKPFTEYQNPKSYAEALKMLYYEIEQKELMRKQRNEAIFGRTHTFDVQTNFEEDDECSPYPQYASVQQVMEATGKLYDEQPLKDYCEAHGLEYMSVPTKNGKIVSDIDLEEDYDSPEDLHNV